MAQAVIVNGTLFPIREEVGFSSDPENGYTFTQRFAGGGANQMVALANQFTANGIKCDYTLTGGIARLNVSDTTAQVTLDTWTVAQNELQKSIFENPLILNAYSSPVNQLFLEDLINMKGSNSPTYEEIKQNLDDADASPEAYRLLKSVAADGDYFAFSGYALRHTTNVGNRYAANVADSNVDAIYTTSKLLTEVQSGTLWVFPLPGRLVYKLQTLASDFISRYGTHAGYQWGWLKRGSTESTAANNRINICTEYWFDEWPTDRYDLA